MGLTKNANSLYSFAGVIQTFEDCSRLIDNKYIKKLRQWKTKELAICQSFPWLRKFPFPAQVILADNGKLAEVRQTGEESQRIEPLNAAGECDCKQFRMWYLLCEHMLEQYIFNPDLIEIPFDKYASLFIDSKFDVYEGRKVDIALVEAGEDSQGEETVKRAMNRAKLDLTETTNKVRDHRYAIEDQVLRFGMLVDRADRVMRALNRAFAIAAQKMADLTVEQLEEMAGAEDEPN